MSLEEATTQESTVNDSLLNMDSVKTDQSETQSDSDKLWANKYKNAEELEKGYYNLVSKLGAFTGAPEEYDVKINEALAEEFELETDSDLFKNMKSFAKESGMSNDKFNEMLNLYVYELKKDLDSDAIDAKTHFEEQIKALGQDSNEVIGNVKRWAAKNVPDEYRDVIKDLGKTASGIKFLNHMSQTSTASIIPNEGVPTGINLEEAKDSLRKMIGDPRFHNDKKYTDMVNSRYKDVYGGA